MVLLFVRYKMLLIFSYNDYGHCGMVICNAHNIKVQNYR